MNKKAVIIIASIVVVVVLGVTAYMLYNGNTVNFLNRSKVEREKKEVKKALQDYMDCIPKKEYEKMYEKLERLSRATNAKETFIDRNKKIYENIKATNIKVDIKDAKKNKNSKDTYDVEYTTSMTVAAGEVQPFDNIAQFVKDKNGKWGLKWDHNLIFPDLTADTKVKVISTTPKRGKLLARNGETLAENGEDGKRVYPQGELCAHVVGYVQKVTAEDLKEHESDGFYDSESVIGRKGLENAFEERLRGKKGITVAVTDPNGTVVKELAKVEGSDGEDVKTTIDLKKQKIVFDKLNGKKAASVWMDPKNGEVLVMVNTPSYDPIKKNVTYNKFAATYCPGSSFKTLNAGIGLTTGSYDTSTKFTYDTSLHRNGASGAQWQKSGWGGFWLHNSHDFSTDFSLHTAIAQSDNIWFGQAALKIGAEKFAEGLDNLGFNKEIPFEWKGFSPSTYGKKEDLKTEGKLASTGFGQGDLLVNPLHMATIYSAFLNEGNLITPHIEYKENRQPEYYKKGAFSKEAIAPVVDGLKAVTKPGGIAASSCSGAKVGMAGKTGTAELKKAGQKTGPQNLWFDGFTYDTGNSRQITYVTMHEGTNSDSSGAVAGWTKDMINKMY